MKIVVADLEANGLLDQATNIWCGVFKDINTEEVVRFTPENIYKMPEFMDSIDVLIMHNGIGYDLPLLRKLLNYKFPGKIVDTLLMSRLLNPKRLLPPNCPNTKAGPHSIESWGYRVGRGKPEHDEWDRYSEAMLHRCTEDVEILHLVYNALMQEAKGRGWGNAFKLTFRLFTHLQKQEEYGWLIDVEHAKACVNQLTRWINLIDKAIKPRLPNVLEINETKEQGEYKYVKKPFRKDGSYSEIVHRWYATSGVNHHDVAVVGPFTRISFRKVDLDSNEEVKDYLLSLGWEPLEWNTNDDGQRTSPKLSKEDAFEGLEDRIGKVVAKRIQCRQRRGVIEGLLENVRPDGRISSVVNNLAVTGRATHRGIVNIPKASSFYGKQMRRIFSSKDGYVLVGTDSAGNQLRQLASRMGNEKFIYAMVSGKKEEGTDPHTLTKIAGDLESRDIAKNTMYCLLFGGGDAKLAKTAKKPPGSGAELRKKLYNGLEGLGDLMERLQKEWRSTAKKRYNPKFNRMEYYDGCITGLDGRPITVPSEHQLLVYLCQSDEAIHMSLAYCLVAEKLQEKYKWGIDYGIVAWIHDEIQIECRKEIAEDVAKICCLAIEDAGVQLGIKCPHQGESHIGRNWYETH